MVETLFWGFVNERCTVQYRKNKDGDNGKKEVEAESADKFEDVFSSRIALEFHR